MTLPEQMLRVEIIDTGVGIPAAQIYDESLGIHMKAVLIIGDTSTAMRELPRHSLMRITSKPVKVDELLTLMRALLAA